MAAHPDHPELKPILEEGHDLKTEPVGNPNKLGKGDKLNATPGTSGDGLQVSKKMSEKVKFEVVGLFKQGLVSQALGVNNFREKLESSLKDACEKSDNARNKIPKPKPRVRSRPREDPDNSLTETVLENQVTRRNSPRQSRRVSSNRASPTPRRPAFTSTPHRHRPRTGYRRNSVPQSLPDDIGQRLSRYNLSEHQRETIVADLRNMVSNQVVSTTLAGEFRGTLELHLRQRAGRIDDGMAPEDIIEEVQRQAGSQTERPPPLSEINDFTATATLPVSSGNSQALRDLTRQIEDMKLQMTEMQRMMRVSFEVSQYIQRSIRQEVSAAMQVYSTPGCSGPQVAPVTVSPPQRAANVSSSGEPTPETVVPAAYGVCVVCTQNKIDSMVYRCGHMCVCQPCGYELIAGNHKCPMCRSPITDIVRVYKSSA
eukprot:TRINITY_DN9206_c0_g1_i1.p1 TRINITY_DN9206_c0_g1~~TRINITY_DN9206_c0_g1_i1.p1  ORF type:complete len:427 (-),score=80.84 TRINITY_DN9206_c0_g1_i1:160-1440(-)